MPVKRIQIDFKGYELEEKFMRYGNLVNKYYFDVVKGKKRNIRATVKRFIKERREQGVVKRYQIRFKLNNGKYFMAPEFGADQQPDTNDHVIEANYQQVGKIIGFALFEYTVNAPHGGKDKMNDCLYNCVISAFPVIARTFGPHHFKKYAGVGRADPVPVDQISRIEEKIRIRIKVFGEHMYDGSDHPRFIRVWLCNEHYEMLDGNKHNIYKYTHGRKTYFYNESDDIATIYDLQSQQFFKKSSEWVRTRPQYDFIGFPDMDDMKRYIESIKTITSIEPELMTDYDIKPIRRASKMLKENIDGLSLEGMDIDETELIRGTVKGGIRFAKAGEYETGFKYDYNSFYPWMLQRNGFAVPIGKPKETILTEFPEYYQYGIYRLEVTGDHELFKKNSSNLYTHFDIKIMDLLNVPYELIQDGETNAYIYEKRKMARAIFEKNILHLYDLKRQTKDPSIKATLNSMTGLLYERNASFLKFTKKPINIDGKNEIIGMNESGIKIVPKDKYYRNDMARFMPFVLANCRLKLLSDLKDQLDKIVFINTDGFVLTEPYDGDNISDKIGELKKEEFGSCVVKNKQKVIFK